MWQGLQVLHQNGILYVFAFAVGASIGSFLNVFVYRWPEEMSLSFPGSHCPACQAPIPWYLNIPILSWLLLMGKCRFCGAGISARYLLVELAGGMWGLISLWRFGPGLSCLACLLMGSALLGGSIIDIKHRLLPDSVTLGLIPLGLVMALLPETWAPGWQVSFRQSLLGTALGGGLFLGVLLIFKRATGKEGMGFGDVKLMAGLGSMVGFMAVPVVVILASIAGILAWLALAAFRIADRDYQVPFGPFLSLGAVVVLLSWQWIDEQLMKLPFLF